MAVFITFEGIEGCGKTTQIKLLSAYLNSQSYPVTVTREPGGCPIADKIRSILLDGENRKMVPLAELLLYAAARAQHVEEIIRPALDDGKIVLCDRFTDATVAYQGFGRDLNLPLIHDLNRLAAGQVQPQMTILLDCPPEIGLGRAISRIESTSGAREERFELESLQFHHRVREGYLQLAVDNPERFIMVDGNRPAEEVEVAIRETVLTRLAGS